MLKIRFWWPGYSPEDALDSFDLAVQETPFEVSRDGGRSWRLPRHGATLETISDWLVDEGRTVVSTDLVGQRHNGRWEGRYVLTFGPRSKGGQP